MWPLGPRYDFTISTIEAALFLTEPVRLEKSCTAPKNTQPPTIQKSTGSHPNHKPAKIGPTMGPAAAIAEKCWLNKNFFSAGTKSNPSLISQAGVFQSFLNPKWRLKKRP